MGEIPIFGWTLTLWFMFYIFHISSVPVIASPTTISACSFLSWLFRKKKKKKGKKKSRGMWVHYPTQLPPQWLRLTRILGSDPFHLSPFICHYLSINGRSVTCAPRLVSIYTQINNNKMVLTRIKKRRLSNPADCFYQQKKIAFISPSVTHCAVTDQEMKKIYINK